MGQGGGACNRCSDVSLNKSLPNKGLDESSSEGEEDEEEAEEEDSDGETALEEEKKNAEHVLSEGLRRGKTGAFTEAIEHATALGLDEDKISLAEKKLEDHKAFRRREAFEAELHEFLRSEDAADKEQCEEKLAQGREYGVGEKVLKPVVDRIAELELTQPLKPDEVEMTKQFLELCTRRFVASCIKGRDLHWVDLDSGGKQKSVMKIDLTLKNLMVQGPPGDLACKVSNVNAKRAVEAAEVVKSKLDDAEREKAVVVELDDGSGPWCFLEGSKAKQDEFICGCHVLNGKLTPIGGRKEQKGATKDKKTDAKGKNVKQSNEEKADEVEEEEEEVSNEAEENEDEEASNLRHAASGEDEELLASPEQSEGSPKNSPKGKKDKKDKKAAKDKGKKGGTPTEKPPPPPPPIEEDEEEEEASEE